MLYSVLVRIKDSTNHLHFAREQIGRWAREQFDRAGRPPYHVLDIGLGTGSDLKEIRKASAGLDVTLHGLESIPDCVRNAREAGINAYPINIERDSLPFPDEFFEVVVANQVIEHTKELFWIFSEISRVVKKGGMVIIGCPNLASWHNRVALLFGAQPPCMKLLSGHLRGITKPDFKRMIERRVLRTRPVSRGELLSVAADAQQDDVELAAHDGGHAPLRAPED